MGTVNTIFPNSSNDINYNLFSQLDPLQKTIVIIASAIFIGIAFLGYALYRSYCSKNVTFDAKSLINLNHVTIAIHDVARRILAVGWEEHAPNHSYKRVGAIYDLKTGELKKTLELNNGDVELRHLMIDPNRGLIIGGLKSHTLAIWRSDGSLYQQTDTKDEISSFGCADEQIIAQCYNSYPALNQFDLTKDHHHSQPFSHSVITDIVENQRTSMHYDGKRKWMSVSSYDNDKIELIQLTDRSVVKTFDTSNAKASIYSEEKEYFIYPATNNTILIHNIPKDKIIRAFVLTKTGEKVVKLSYHEHTNRLIAVTAQASWGRIWIRIWDVKTGESLNEFMTIPNKNDDLCSRVSCLLYLPERDLLMTGDNNYDAPSCYLWDLKTKKLAKEIKLPKALPITQMSFDKTTSQLYITQRQCHAEHECETSFIDLRNCSKIT